MREVVEDLRRTVEEAAERLLALGEGESEARRGGGEEGWSAKETLGHLIDSAANNHGRFVRAQFKDDLVFEGYAQEEWVAAQKYQSASWPQLVALWRLYNLHLAHVMEHARAEELARPRHPHSLQRIAWQLVDEREPATLEYLMRDYVGHLKHHLAQIFAAVARTP
ncbi:MAG TPA: DinB family protein [Pyrinomonadaceae bacterium]|nr:DinB family protein [Pyrinomonadaceae bacterium]